MKLALLSVLRCPNCRSTLDLETLESKLRKPSATNTFAVTHCKHWDVGSCEECSKQEVIEGVLTCTCCHARFPIVNAVPRMLPGTTASFPDFWARWQDGTGGHSAPKPRAAAGLDREYQQVVRHFQAQWHHWGKDSKSFGRDIEGSLQFLRWTLAPRDSDDSFFDRKLILDGGCGHGKYLVSLSGKNSEVIGMDITRSVDLCQELVGHLDHVHVIQGDVIHPPLASGIFDYVYSNGVIHHTPDTRGAFRSLATLTRKGGVFSVWVYPHRARWYDILQGAIRSVTTRLPSSILRPLCYIPVPLLSVSAIGAYSGTNLRNASWTECAQVVFDFYGPRYQTHHTPEEITQWYRENGYQAMQLGPDPLSVIGFKW